MVDNMTSMVCETAEMYGWHSLSDIVLVRDALNMKGCYSLIIAHNHPSGSIQPSEADRNMTNLLKKACEYFQLYLFDSIIVGDGKYYSFCDDCKL